MSFASGRVRDVTFTATFTIDGLSAGRQANLPGCTPDIDPYISKHAYGEVLAKHAGTSDGATAIEPFVFVGHGGTDSIGASIFGLNGTLIAGLYYGDPLTWQTTGAYATVPAPLAVPFEISFTETVTVSLTFANCEDRFEVVDLDGGLTDTINGREWPNYGGAATDDFLDGRKVTHFEWCPAGSTVTITASCTGGTVTQTRTLTTGCVVTYPWNIVAEEEATARETFCEGPYTAQGDITWAVALNGEAAVADWGTAPVDAQGQSVDWNRLRARATSSPSSVGLGVANADHFLGWPIEYEGEAKIFAADGSDYAGTLNLVVDGVEGETPQVIALAPSGAFDVRQEYYILTGGTNLASRTTKDRTQYQGVRSWLSPGSIAAMGEAADDWVMMWRGRQWRAGVLQQRAKEVLQDGTSAAEWTGATSSGGVLTIS